MISKREQLEMGYPLYGMSSGQRPHQEEPYAPKHMKRYDRDGMSHCCFAGCTPMGCPGRCCIQGFGHRADCPENPGRLLDDAHHDIYVQNGGRKHLAKIPYLYTTPRYRCPSCGAPMSSPAFGCGPSGCINRPA